MGRAASNQATPATPGRRKSKRFGGCQLLQARLAHPPLRPGTSACWRCASLNRRPCSPFAARRSALLVLLVLLPPLRLAAGTEGAHPLSLCCRLRNFRVGLRQDFGDQNTYSRKHRSSGTLPSHLHGDEGDDEDANADEEIQHVDYEDLEPEAIADA